MRYLPLPATASDLSSAAPAHEGSRCCGCVTEPSDPGNPEWGEKIFGSAWWYRWSSFTYCGVGAMLVLRPAPMYRHAQPCCAAFPFRSMGVAIFANGLLSRLQRVESGSSPRLRRRLLGPPGGSNGSGRSNTRPGARPPQLGSSQPRYMGDTYTWGRPSCWKTADVCLAMTNTVLQARASRGCGAGLRGGREAAHARAARRPVAAHGAATHGHRPPTASQSPTPATPGARAAQFVLVLLQTLGPMSFPHDMVGVFTASLLLAVYCKRRAAMAFAAQQRDAYMRWHTAWHCVLPGGAAVGMLLLD